MAGMQNGYSQVKRQVNYCTVKATFCAIPACVNRDSITDLDRVRMMYNDLVECTENVIGMNNHLTITTYYPQEQRYENDYQYKIGKSVVSVEGTFLYDHEGNELSHSESDDDEIFILSDVYAETYGVFNSTYWSAGKDAAIQNLLNAGFIEAYEDGEFVVGILENFEMAINFDEFTIEMRYFNDGDNVLRNLHRTSYAIVNGYTIPIEETMVKYSVLPSGIPYQITEVKSYLYYQVIQDDEEIVFWGEDFPYYSDYLHKSIQPAKKGGDIEQFEEIQKRQTEIKVFPNPAEGQITVSLPFYMDKNVDITLYNTLGVAVLSKHHTKGEKIDIDINALPAGVYVVRCVKDYRVISTRFVKH